MLKCDSKLGMSPKLLKLNCDKTELTAPEGWWPMSVAPPHPWKFSTFLSPPTWITALDSPLKSWTGSGTSRIQLTGFWPALSPGSTSLLLLIYLHLLPVKSRLAHMILLLTCKTPRLLSGCPTSSSRTNSPGHLNPPACVYSPSPAQNTALMGDRAFRGAAPTLWKSLKKHLKTYLFNNNDNNFYNY